MQLTFLKTFNTRHQLNDEHQQRPQDHGYFFYKGKRAQVFLWISCKECRRSIMSDFDPDGPLNAHSLFGLLHPNLKIEISLYLGRHYFIWSRYERHPMQFKMRAFKSICLILNMVLFGRRYFTPRA